MKHLGDLKRSTMTCSWNRHLFIVVLFPFVILFLGCFNGHYQPRAMPSYGAIPFLQTYLCNLDNPCYRSYQKLQSALTTTQQFSAMTQNLGPLLSSDEVLDVLAVSNKTSNVYTMIKKAVGNKDLLHGLEDKMNVSSYFRDAGKVKSILVDDYKLLSKPEADALLNSRINVGQLTNLTGSHDFKAIACDSKRLGQYVKFPSDTNIQDISKALCNITEDQTSGLANLMIRELNFTTILDALKLMEEVKETFLDDHNILSYSFEIVAQMFQVVTQSDEVMKLLGTFTGIPDVASLIRKIPGFVEGFQDFDSIMNVLKDVVSNIEPLMKSLKLDNMATWLAVKDAIRLSENFVMLGEGRWNGTSQEFMEPMKSLLKNIEEMAKDEDGRVFIAFFQFLNKMDWVKAYDEIIYTQTLSESTMKTMLVAGQEMLEQMSLWETMKPIVRIEEHTLDVLVILIEKSIDLKHALKHLFDSNDIIKNEIKKIFAYGPVITHTVLNSFINDDIFTDISNDASYHDVCSKALMKLNNQVPPDVYNDVRDTFCSDAGDVATGFNHLLKTLKLNEIGTVINETVHEFEKLYKGEFFKDNVQLVDMLDQNTRFTTALNSYLYDDYKWFQVFEGVYLDDIDFNTEGWEPVTDMLDENVLTTLLLGSFQSIGKAFINSPLANEFAPTIHVMSETVKLVYETLEDVNKLVARDTPLMKLSHMLTKYSPEIIDGVTHMMDTDSNLMIDLLTSNDALTLFCTNDYIDKMGMPSYVPVSDLESMVCNTDWNRVITDMTQPAQRIEALIPKMADLMRMSQSYNLETDWIQIEEYSQKLFDLISRGQILGVIDMRTTTVEFFGQLDFSRFDEAMSALNRMMEKMMADDIMMGVEMFYKLTTLLEEDNAETSLSDLFKASMIVFESSLDQQIESIKNPQNMTSLMGMLQGLEPSVRDMVILLAKAYPQFVSAAAEVMYQPTKLTAKIVSMEATPPDCHNVFLSDYLSLDRDSHVHRFEVYLCTLNLTQFMEELFQSQTSAFLGGSDDFNQALSGNKNVPDIDWRKLQDKINEYNQLVMAPPQASGSFDMAPFDMTAINMAWEKFHSAADALSRLDPNKIEKLQKDIMEIMATSVDRTGDRGMQLFFYSNMYLGAKFTKAILQEMSAFNTTSPVILVDYLGSEELKKLMSFLIASPDINAVGVATLYRLISAPQKAIINTDFEAMCQNLTLFSQVFVVSASAMKPVDLQQTICHSLSSVNISKLMEQLLDRPSIQTLEQAMNVLDSENLSVMKAEWRDSTKNSEQLNSLIESLVMQPPRVMMTSMDDVWMKAEIYARDWETLGSQLERLMDTSLNDSWWGNWESIVSHLVVESLRSVPDSSLLFGYVNAFVDITQGQLDDNTGDFFEKYRQFPNTALVVNLMNNVPGAIQTVLYTILRQSQKLEAWTEALESWDGFCMTPSDDIFSVPPGLQFNMTNFKDKLCSTDGDELVKELGQSQRMDKIDGLFDENSPVTSNATSTENKLRHLLETFTHQTTTGSGDDMAESFTLRLFNETVWDEVFKRMETWLNDTATEVMSPVDITDMIATNLNSSIAGMSPEVAEMITKGLAVADVVVGELIYILNSNSLDQAFHEVASMKPFIYLLNSVPELILTVFHTATFHSDVIVTKLEAVKSFEEFCVNHPEEILHVPPKVTFDVNQWMDTLCSINATLLDQLMQYKTAKHIHDIVENSLKKPVNLTELLDKTERLIDQFQKEIPLNERVFDPSVWEAVIDNVDSWKEEFGSQFELLTQIENSVITILQSAPDTKQVLHYLDAILDLVGTPLQDSQVDVKQAFDGFPSIKTVLLLLDRSPEMIETVLYTLFTQPHKMAAWSLALQSWTTFCSTPPSDIMMVPPGSKFNVTAYLAEMCTINLDRLVTELNEFEGGQRLMQIDMDNTTTPLDANSTFVKMKKLTEVIEDLIENPMESNGLDLRLLNMSVWNRIGNRMEQWLDDSSSKYGSELAIADLIQQVYMSTVSQMPEAKDVFVKMVSMAGLVTDQLIDAIHAGSISSTFGNSTSLKNLVHLANNVPELLEVLIYTSQKHPEKLSSQTATESFMSLEALCQSTPEDIFTVPPGVTFDLKAWFAQLCALNMTDVENQLVQLKTAKDLEAIIHGASMSDANMTSLVSKIDTLMELLNDQPILQDRILNEFVWYEVMTRLQQWMDESSVVSTDPSRYFSEMFKSMEQLQADPWMREALRPLTVVIQVMENLMDNIIQLDNKTSIQGKDLFLGWQGMEKMMTFLQTPGVFNVLIASAGNYQKLSPLTSEEGLKDLCDPTTDPGKYLTGNDHDLQRVKTAFCNINFDEFMDGFDSFIDIDTVEKIADGSLTFDWKAYEHKLNKLFDLLTKWEKQPPTFDLPPQWGNESYWQNLLDSSMSTLPEKLSAKEQVLSILKDLGPLLDTEGFKQFGMILNRVMDILNMNIKSMQGARYTLGGLIQFIPALSDLFTAVGVNSQTLQSFALSPIKNTDAFMQLFVSDDVQNDFCNTDKWKKAIDFPADFDTSGLVQTICSNDWQTILHNMEDNFNLTQTISSLLDNSSHVQDWMEATVKIFDLVDKFELVLNNPPSLNADKTLSILSESYNMTNLFKLASAFSVLSQAFENMTDDTGMGNVMTQTSDELGKIVGMTVGVLDNILARVRVGNGRLDIAGLFKDVPEVERIIQGVLDMKPDPLTGLFAVVLKADQISDFMSWNRDPSKLQQLFCDKATFERTFHIRTDVDVNKLIKDLCNLDWDTVADKLEDSFWSGDDMSNKHGLDVEDFSHSMEDIIFHLTNLSNLEYVMYNGTDLARIFVVNETRLMELWEDSGLGEVPEEYVTLTTHVLNSVFNDLNQNGDLDSLSTSLKFMVAYLESFNAFLRSVKDQPIRLSMLLNNTEVGAILTPILTDQNILDGLMDMTVHINKLSEIVSGPSPEISLCGDELFKALKIPTNEIPAFKDLQTRVCSTNQTVLLWQTVMLQANGYYLQRQMEFVEQEITEGKTSINTTLVAVDMEEMITLMQVIIGQYMDGSRSFSDFLDTDKLKQMLEHTQRNIADRLLEASKHWSVDMANIILPKVIDQQYLLGLSRSLDTINLFMNLTIIQLKGMDDGSLDVSDFFLEADGLQNMMEAYIRLGKNLGPAWSNGKFDTDKIGRLFKDSNQVSSLCRQPGGISQSISSTSPASQAVQDLSTVVCSIMGAAMSEDVKNAIGYNQIGDMLMSIWQSPKDKPDYSTFIRNVDTFTRLVQDLASKSFTIRDNLLNVFNLQDTLSSLQNIAQNPQIIFQVIKLLGIGIDTPLAQDPQAVKSLSQTNSLVLMPLIRIFEGLQAKGVTVTNMADNPNSFLDLLSVLLDFDVHYAAIAEAIIKPQIKTLDRNTNSWCVDQAYRDMVRQRLAVMPRLPVTADDVLSVVCSQDSSTWMQKFKEMGLSRTQINVVLDKMMVRSDLFEMYDDQFKWVDLMSSLEKLSDLVSESGIKSGSKMADVHSAWNATKDILFEKGFKSLFSYIEMIEISAPPTDPDWLVFKQFLRFFSSVMTTLDTNLQGLTDKDHLVQLQDALPDSHRVGDLITRLIGSENAAELLVTMVDPIQFYKLSLYNSWTDICDGKTNITTYFYFPDHTDIEGLTTSLCQAVKARNSAFDELLSLFGARDMFKQLDMLLQHQWNATDKTSVYDYTHSAMMHLIHTLEGLQQAMIADGSVDNYLHPVMKALESYSQSQQTVGLCKAVSSYLNQTDDFPQFHTVFSKVFTALDLASDMAGHVEDLDDLACSLNDNKEISLKNFMNKLEDVGIINDIQKAVDEFMNPPDHLKCSAPITFSNTVMEVINATVMGGQLDIGQMDRCVQDTTVEFRQILSSASKLLDFIEELVGALQSPSINKFLNDPEILSFLNFIMHGIDINNHKILKFEDLLQTNASVTTYLTDTLGIPGVITKAFMNSSVDQDWNKLLSQTVNEVRDILCDPSRLSQVLTLPEGSGVNMTQISEMICTNEITDTVMYLKNLSARSDQIDKRSGGGNDLIKIVTDLTNGLADLITHFDGIVQLFVDLATKEDLDIFEGNADVIDDIIQGDLMERFGMDMKKIFNSVKPFFSTDATTQAVIRDVEKIIDGIIAIEVIIKGPVVETLEVEDLVLNVAGLRKYMTDDLKFSPDMVDTILQSVFSTRVLLGLESKPVYSCQEVFEMILVMNGTGKTPDEVSKAFCQLNDQQLTGLVNALKMELDIGAMVAKYVSYTTDSILVSTNMTKDELNDMVTKIDKSQIVIQQATNEFKQMPNGSQILEIFAGADTDAFTGMDKLTPLMCGQETTEMFGKGLTDGLVITSNDRFSQEIHKGINHDVDDLPNEFCVDIYKNIRNSEIGSIIWAYVKPIMRGKILYTPDNEVTRAIIQKANKTFETIAEVQRSSSIWANQAPNLMSMTVPVDETEGLRDALENDFVKGLLESTLGVSATNVLTGLDALQSNNFDKDDLTALQAVAEIISNYTSCIEMDRFIPIATEKDLELEAYKLNLNKTFWGGIVFTNTEVPNPNTGRRKRQSDPDIPKHVTYKIRMDVDNVMDTARLKSSMYKMAAEDGFVEDMRYLRGFIYLQDILDNSIIEFHKNPVLKTPGLKIQQMPFPCHHYDSFVFMLGSYLVPIMMTFVFLASIGSATNNLTYDRENGQEQTLSVMGMMSGLNFLSWFVTTMMLMTVVVAVLAVMMKYTDIFIYSNPFIIFLFLLTFCFSSVMLLYLVSAFFNRSTLAILFVLMIYLISYLPYILVVSLEITMEPWQKNLACLASTTAFSFGAHNLGYMEESGKGVQWSNIDEEGAKDYSMHWACMMMLIDSAIYLVIGWYVRHVKPGKYGVAKPWYFPLSPSFWCGCFDCAGTGNKYLLSKHPEESKGSLFEAGPPGHQVGIQVTNLSKSYGKKNVLCDLTINFYEGQISCLLGHNGAAKTTALKLLCGILDPSTGSVLLNGKKPTKGKHSLGVCPQQNALFHYMSVLEHMEFYSGIKGSDITIKRMTEIKKLLKDVDLWHVRNVTAGDLSYGMKRRLCVALAFVGGSRTVVLDEPTSGIDPHARKNIWNLISSNRPGRTILLSTHHLDEADIIGDRIAILHKGRLLCNGSPSFLKRQIGGGYKLTISKFGHADGKEQVKTGAQPECSETPSSADSKILNFIQAMSPTSQILESMGTEMVVDIPKDERLMNVPLPVFFQELDTVAKDIGVLNYGLTDTKVEDIFLQLTLEMDKADQTASEGVSNPALVIDESSTVNLPETSIQTSTDTGDHQPSVDTKKRCSGGSLVWAQAMALLLKRFHHYRRNWRMLLTCVILPLLAFMVAIGFSTIRPDEGDQRPLVLDPVLYGKNTYTFLQQKAEDSSKAARLTDTFRNSTIGVGTSCMADVDQANRLVKPSCDKGTGPYVIKKPLYVISCKEAMQEYHKIDGQEMIVEEQTLPNDLYLQNMDDYNIPNYILRTFKDYKDKRFGGWSIEKAFEEDDPAEYEPYAWFNSKGYHAMPSFFSGLSNSILRANLPFYENPEEYGITTINHPIRLGRSPLTLKTLENDAADSGISIMVVLAFSFIPCGFILYIINERVQKEKQLQQISGVGTLMYWMVSWMWDMFIYLIAVGVAVGIVCLFEVDSFYIRDNLSAFAVLLILYGWAMIPYIYLASRFFRSASTAYLVTFCTNLFLALATVVTLLVLQLFREDKDTWEVYKVCRYAFLIFPQFALGQGLMDMVSATVKYKLFLRFDQDLYDDPYHYDITGYKIVAMAIFGFVFFILNLLAEKIHARALRISKKHSETSSEIDEDVSREKERIEQHPKDDLLQVHNLSKVYRRGWKKFCAVDHVNFGVQEGESFGLLGVNGAGKTTTFRMLTGDLGSSGGTVMFNGRRISSHDRHFGQAVGYCPQEGGLDEYLTATETLHFHARLRGFDQQQSNELVSQLLTRLGLSSHASKAVHTYSGGTKRKLALAVAMLGDPPILYLDEPTTGMDAATRRQVWKCIGQANRNGQSVVLTSHTMDECDALCSRIAIMVNGQIKCLGSPQHLKHKFGDGYTALVHSQKDNLGSVSHFFLNQFPGSIVRANIPFPVYCRIEKTKINLNWQSDDKHWVSPIPESKHHSSIEVMIPSTCGTLSDILAVLQRAQAEDMLEYYSLSQTTLDSVFVSFAQEQTDSFEEGTVTYSSSIEDKSYSASSSVSSERPPSYDAPSNGKKESPYIFSNPQFVVTEDENEPVESQPRPRYVSNITLAAEMAAAPKNDLETGENTRL